MANLGLLQCDVVRQSDQAVAQATFNAKAIVDMRLSQLTGLRIEELKQQYEDLLKLIE